MSSLSRQNSFRCFVVVVLAALLVGGVLLHSGNLPALLTGIFVFLFILTFSDCPAKEAAAALPGDFGEQAPARAPPILPV